MIARAINCVVGIINAKALQQAACALRDLSQLLMLLRRGWTFWPPFIEPKPQGSSFELSFEIRDRLDRAAECKCDLLKVTLCVGGRLKPAHFAPTFFSCPSRFFAYLTAR